MPGITTRLATAADAEMIADISRQTFYDTFASRNSKEDMDKFMTEKFTREALMKEVEVPGNIFVLAFEKDKIVGYARLRESENPVEFRNANAIEMARIYAAKNAIGRGVGKALMQSSIDIAKEKGKQIIWLGVWKENQRAIDFYTRWGFTIFAEHDFILGNDLQKDWLMKKML